jgi:hypothetical protein
MGNNAPRMKLGKQLTNENVTELSALSGFTGEQVREWHVGFLVSLLNIFLLSYFILMNNISLVKHIRSHL